MHHQPQQQTTASVHANSNSTSTAPLPLQGSSSLTDANNSSNKFAIVDLTDEVKLKTQFKGDKLLKVNKQFRSNSEFQSNYFFFKTKKRKGASTASSEPTPNSDDEIESELNHAQHFYNEKSISQNPESNLKRRNTICMVQTSISTSAVGGQQHQQQHQQQQHNIDMMMNPTKANTSLQGDHSVSPKRQGPQHLARAQSFSFPQEYYSGPRNKSSHQHHQSMPILNNQAFNVQLNGNGNTIQSGHNNSNYYNHDNIYTPTKIIRLKKDVPQTPIVNTENDMNSHQLFHLTRNDQLGSSTGSNITPNQFNSTPNCSQHAQTNVFPNADRAQINSPSGTSNNDFFSRLILSQQQQQAVDTKASLVTSPRTPRVTSPRGFSINRSGRSSSASYNYRRASMSSESLMSSFRSPSNHNNNFDPMVIGTLIASLSNNNNTNNNMNAMNGNNMMNATAANNMMFQNSMSGFLSNTNSNQNNTCISNNQGNNMSYPPQAVSPQQIPSQLSFLFQQQAQPQSMNVNTSSLSCTQPMTIVQHKQNRPQQLFLSRSYSPGTDACTDNSITPRSMHSTDSELNSFSHLMLVDSESSTPRQGYSQAQNMESTSVNEEINACLDDIRAFMDENSFLPDEFRTFEFPAQTHQANEHLPQTEYCFFNTSTMNENKSNEDVALQQSAHDVASIPPVFNNNNNPSQQLSQPAAQTNPTEQDEIDEIEQFLSLFA